MKNLLKYALIFAAGLFTLASCWDEDIDSKDTYADYETVSGPFAYIVDATQANYEAVYCNIYHTPDGDDGSITRTFEVALTEAQSSSVTITIVQDDDAVSSDYSAFPSGTLSFDSSVTIAAGSTSATVTVTASSSAIASLDDGDYMAVFAISDAGSMKVSSNSNIAYLYATVESIDPADNIVYMEEAEVSYSLKHYTDDVLGDSIYETITVTGTEEAYTAFEVVLAVDNTLIDAYNEANGTSYEAVPSDIINIENPYMEADATEASGAVYINDSDRWANLDSENGYLIPIVVESVDPATLNENCGVYYIAIDVTLFETTSDLFSALYLGDYNMATWYFFDSARTLTDYTIIFHVMFDEITSHSRIGDFADANENYINMLRYGQKGDYDTRLEWYVGPNGYRHNLYGTAIEAQTWVCYALQYDSDDQQYRFYQDGELVDYTDVDDSEAEYLAANPFAFQAIEFNSSWGANYREGNEFHGRLWGVSVWDSAWSLGTMQYYMMYQEPEDWVLYYYGGTYWGFDEGTGYIVYENEWNGVSMGDIDFSNTTRCDDESSMTSADVSSYVQWKTDQYNKFE